MTHEQNGAAQQQQQAWSKDQAAAEALFAELNCPDDWRPPSHGWLATFSREFASCQPFHRPRWHQLLELLLPSLRYLFKFYLRKRFIEKRRPFIDGLVHVPYEPVYGVPLGGLGCGSIGRGFRGEFRRFQLVPGLYEYEQPEADCFIVTLRKRGGTVFQRALVFKNFRRPAMAGWASGMPEESCAYHGLYPQSWTVYKLPYRGVRLLCRQTSPVVPHDYTDSCLPVALFEWRVENSLGEDLEVSLTFCFKNGDGTSADRAGGVTVEPFNDNQTGQQTGPIGALIHQQMAGLPCTYGVAAMPADNSSVTIWPRFDPAKDPTMANRLWYSLLNTGRLISWPQSDSDSKFAAENDNLATKTGEEIATAVCVTSRVPARQSVESAKFCLAWHMPSVKFHAGQQSYTRRHVRWFNGSQSEATIALIRHAFRRLPDWLDAIRKWHSGVLNDAGLPDWFKSAVFNESYYLSDSGSVWLDGGDVNAIHSEPGRWACPVKADMGLFAYLEGHEYRMYSTYDVHTYASWAFLENFPKLQMAIQYDFAKAALDEDQTKVYWVVTNTRTARNQRMALPHDLGDPEDEPFIRVNSYIMMCSDDWRDLNPKFVLCVYRDWKLLPEYNAEYLADMMPAVEGLMRHCLQWDTDNDGLVENTGYADQTYDAWPMTGVSAYCAGLWLAALRATAEMSAATTDRSDSDAAEWRRLADRARASYLAKLWTGEQFRFDTGGRFSDTVMSDQLFGYWMLKASQPVNAEKTSTPDEEPLLPDEAVRVTMETVFKCNCLAQSFNGQMGLFNGGRLIKPPGPELRSIQAEESWIGVSYGVAALMLEAGLTNEAWTCAGGTYRTVWDNFGLAYQTPEAIFSDGRFRSLGYMRPLCIWALLRAARKAAASK